MMNKNKIIIIAAILAILAIGVGFGVGKLLDKKAANQAEQIKIQQQTAEKQALTEMNQVLEEAYKTDFDLDGLSDDEEVAAGTDSQNADTDYDGLSDWVEINIYRTKPLLADTDDDGIKDGLEVRTNTDPLKK